MQCGPLSNGLDYAGGRRATDLFEGAPHVHRGGVLTKIPPAAAFCRNDGIPKGPFAYVESATILRGQSALPASSSAKMCLPELGEVGGPPGITRGAHSLQRNMGLDSRLESCGQLGGSGVQV